MTLTGLQQLHPTDGKKERDAIIGELVEGMPEDRFWATFAQCFVCKAVTLRKDFATTHACGSRDRRGHPYTRPQPATPTPNQVDSQAWNVPFDMPSSPTSTEAMELDVFADAGYVFEAEAGLTGPSSSTTGTSAQTFPQDAEQPQAGLDNSPTQSDGIPLELDDGFELPSIAEIIAMRRRPAVEVANRDDA